MNARCLFVIICSFLLLSAGVAQADKAETNICHISPHDCLCKTAPLYCENPFHIPQDWFACKIDDDCGRVSAGPGSVRSPAVNKEHLDEAKAIICKADPNACSEKPTPPYAIPRCKNGRCELEYQSFDLFIPSHPSTQ